MLYSRHQCSVHVGLLVLGTSLCVKESITWGIPGVTLHVPHHQCQRTSPTASAAEPCCSSVCSGRSNDGQGPSSTHCTHFQALYLLDTPCSAACAALGVEGSTVNAVTHAIDS